MRGGGGRRICGTLRYIVGVAGSGPVGLHGKFHLHVLQPCKAREAWQEMPDKVFPLQVLL